MDKQSISQLVTLRPAQKGDCRRIFYLFNNEEVRRNSISQEKVSYDNHKSWFLSKLSDKNTLLMVAEVKGVFAGQVRFDIDGNCALTSVSLHKRFRGYGLGKVLLVGGLSYLREAHPEIRVATGQIKPDNIAAIKNSKYAGFEFEKMVTVDGVELMQFICDLGRGRDGNKN
jgi:ribosomal protein S18 acetylase RimI-like enzyme